MLKECVIMTYEEFLKYLEWDINYYLRFEKNFIGCEQDG